MVPGGVAMTPGRTARLRSRGRRRPDDQVLDRAVAGDPEAFVAVLRQHDDRLRALAAKLLGRDQHRLDDALQEAYIGAYRALARFRGEADVATWLYRITYNACMDELRRAGRRPEPVDTGDAAWDRPATGSTPDVVVSAADAVDRALDALPLEQRGALVLVVGEGFDHGTAARILDVPVGTVASRVSRARAAVRRFLGEEGS